MKGRRSVSQKQLRNCLDGYRNDRLRRRRVTGDRLPVVYGDSMVDVKTLAVALTLVVSAESVAASDTQPGIPPVAIPTVKCLYNLFRSSPAVLSADLYVIDNIRSAVEYRFKGENGSVITGELMLLSISRVTYDITISRNEPQAAGWESLEFFDKLNAGSKCPITPAFDSLTPGPKPRTEWRQVDWSTLLPSPASSPLSPSPLPSPTSSSHGEFGNSSVVGAAAAPRARTQDRGLIALPALRSGLDQSSDSPLYSMRPNWAYW